MTRFGGTHSATASLTNIFEHEGLLDPVTGKPLTEAMIFGIGGGLGAGYILWEFKERDSANLVLGFRNRWNYQVDYVSNLCERLNIKIDMLETKSTNKAQDSIDEALENGKAVLLWTDKACIPYHGLLEEHKRHFFHLIGVHHNTGDTYTIDDIAPQAWTLSREELIEAHEPIATSNKQRTMTFDVPSKFDLKSAVMSGIQDHLEHLGRNSKTFSLPVYSKWAKMLMHPTNKKGWRTVFKERAGLYVTLCSTYEWITFDDTEGAGLRDFYAGFLTEADALLDADLTEAIQSYRSCARLWREFANIAFSDDVPGFAHAKALLQERYSSFAKQDVDTVSKNVRELNELEQKYHRKGFPLDDDAIDTLFEAMHHQLNVIYDAEQVALKHLKMAVS